MRRSMLALVCAALLAPALPVEAQAVRLGVAGGPSIPEGDLRDVASEGWHALGTVGLSSLLQPLGLRLDIAYNRFERRAEAPGLADGSESVGSATLNASYRLPMTDSPMSPYLISGLGAYRSACSDGAGCEAATRFGWNVGLGTRLHVLGLRSFLEARYHRTGRGELDVHYFPVTFGLEL